MKSVGVFFGGKSVEHDISVITGVLISNALIKAGYEAVPVYLSHSGKWYTGNELLDVENYKNLNESRLTEVLLLPAENGLYSVKKQKKIKRICNLSVAINCMHGERGEDGSLAGLLKMCAIPLASPSVLPSSISMDKRFTKIFLKGIGVKALPYICTGFLSDYKELKERVKYPVIIKPNKLGSSIGISEANDFEELKKGINEALRYGDLAVIEPKLTNFIEINCACYKNSLGKIVVSECEKPTGVKDVLSFEDKYCGGKREFPANIKKSVSDKIKRTAEKIYKEGDFSGVIRIDFFYSEGNVLVNEINSVPGSLSYYLFSKTITDFKGVLKEIITVAEREYAKEMSYKKKFDSCVLNITGGKSSKRL